MATATAPQGWLWSPSLDALTAAPDHHRLLLENDHVRVLEVHIPAGATVPLHTHCWPSVLHLIQWADIIRRDEHNTIVLDTRELDAKEKKVGITWCTPYPPHTVQNVDTVDLLA